MDPCQTPARRAPAGGVRAARQRAGVAAFLLGTLAIAGCDRPPAPLAYASWDQLPPPPDSILFRADSLEARAARARLPSVRYRPYVISGARTLWKLQLAIGAEALEAALRVSRLDRQHVSKGDTIVVPSTIDSLLLSPFPQEIPAAGVIPKLLLVSLRVQAFGAYERGRLARWGATSTGRRDKPTPAGLYYSNWKAKERFSTIDEGWLLKWAVNLDSDEGIALHEYGLLGRPASHSCVRLAEDDARWLYDWVDSWRVARDRRRITRYGTPVLIFGEYAYSRRKPWIRLIEDPHATTLSAQELDETLADYFYVGPPAPYWLRLTPLPRPEPPRPPMIAERATTP